MTFLDTVLKTSLENKSVALLVGREKQVLQLAAQGLTDIQIAQSLGISKDTVGTYWRRILLRLDSSSRTEAVAKAARNDVVALFSDEEVVPTILQESLLDLKGRSESSHAVEDSSALLVATYFQSMVFPLLCEDADRKIVAVNKAFCSIFEPDSMPSDWIGRDCQEELEKASVYFCDPNQFMESTRQLLDGFESRDTVKLIDGRVFERQVVRVESATSRVKTLWAYEDITTTAREVEMLESLLDSSLDASIIIDQMGVIEYWNKGAVEIFGFDSSEVVGHRLDSLIIPDRFVEGHRSAMARFLDTGETSVMRQRVKLPARTSTGTEILVELCVAPIELGGDVKFGAFLRLCE